MPGFGISKYGVAGLLENLLATCRPLGTIDSTIVLRDAYDITYEIFDHEKDNSRPLALVGVHEKENVTEYGAMYRMIYQFNTYEIAKNWGCSLSEFLEYPREVVRLVLRICSENSQRSLLPTEKQLELLRKNT